MTLWQQKAAFSVCYKNGISINRQNGFVPNADPYGEITGQHNAVQGSNVVKQKRAKQQLTDAKAAYLRTDCSSILDELSYLSFNRHQSELLFKVISDRSEKSSTIVTTNLPFSKWTDLFENTTMVAALIDRLTFHSHILDMNGDSYRLRSTLQDRL